MYRIGIDVGSTFTKYCVLEDDEIISRYSERSPIRQREYFAAKIEALKKEYSDPEIISCGYGKHNIEGARTINELTALARGIYRVTNRNVAALDIGGQDIKLITQNQGHLTQFFINEKCAAGSGLFLMNTLTLLGRDYKSVNLSRKNKERLNLSSTCVVFAQSEIVELIADNKSEEDIVDAVVSQIIVKAKSLLRKVNLKELVLTGGFTQIDGICDLIEEILEVKCEVVNDGEYITALGCASI